MAYICIDNSWDEKDIQTVSFYKTEAKYCNASLNLKLNMFFKNIHFNSSLQSIIFDFYCLLDQCNLSSYKS